MVSAWEIDIYAETWSMKEKILVSAGIRGAYVGSEKPTLTCLQRRRTSAPARSSGRWREAFREQSTDAHSLPRDGASVLAAASSGRDESPWQACLTESPAGPARAWDPGRSASSLGPRICSGRSALLARGLLEGPPVSSRRRPGPPAVSRCVFPTGAMSAAFSVTDTSRAPRPAPFALVCPSSRLGFPWLVAISFPLLPKSGLVLRLYPFLLFPRSLV